MSKEQTEQIITIKLPNKEWEDAFWGWFLDGGGDDEFMSTLNDLGLCEMGNTGHDWDLEKQEIWFTDET